MAGKPGRSGGARRGAGRRPGAQNKATKARKKVAEELLQETAGDAPQEGEAASKPGKTPLHVIVKLYTFHFDQAVNDEGEVIDVASLEKAATWASAAAPYMHPKLAAVDGSPGSMEKSHEEALKELE